LRWITFLSLANRQLNLELATDELVRILEPSNADRPHQLAKLLASDLLGPRAFVHDINVPEYHATRVRRPANFVSATDVLPGSFFRDADFGVCDLGGIPAFWKRLVITAAFGQFVCGKSDV